MIEREEADHWKELAEQLGLPAEPVSESSPSPRAEFLDHGGNQEDEDNVAEKIAADQIVAETKEEERGRPRPRILPEPAATKEDVRPNLILRQEAEEFDSVEDHDPVQTLSFEARQLPAKSESEEVPPTETHDEFVGENAEAPEEETTRGRRRRGGRGGKRRQEGKSSRGREDNPKAKRKAEPPEKKEAVDPIDDFPEDTLEDLSDLAVPSWQELISSLYRPER